MPLTLSRQFLDIAAEDGLESACRSAGRFVSSQVDSLVTGLRLRALQLRTGSSTVVREVNGSQMRLDVRPSSPHTVEQTLAIQGVREPASTETFRDVLATFKAHRDDQIHVFDVGANVGYFALLEANVLGDQGSVYAIEAEPENAARLARNVERNEYSQVEVLQVAAGAENSTLELSVKERANAHRMCEIDDRSAADRVAVDVRPLDELADARDVPEAELAVVRIDTEGYEGRVLEGMSDLLAADRPLYLFVELHPAIDAVDVGDICDRLQAAGFEPEYVSRDGGTTISRASSFDDVRGTTADAHLMASRL